MQKISTPISDLYCIEPKVFKDDRGYFFESYNKSKFDSLGLEYTFVQDNESFSEKGVFRGFHFQTGSSAQAKLVRVVYGDIIDIAIDLRTDSLTFGQSFSTELTDKNYRQLLIPRGLAHGFFVISDYAKVLYKADNFYNPKAECGLNLYSYFNKLSLPSGINFDNIKLNEKDSNYNDFDAIADKIKNNEILVY